VAFLYPGDDYLEALVRAGIVEEIAVGAEGEAVADSVEDYLAECRARGLRSATVRDSYGWPLRRLWLPWCAEHGVTRLGEVTQPVVNRFTVSLRDRRRADGRSLSPHSIRTYGVVITRWLAWALRSGVRVPSTRVSRPVREVVTDEEYARMLEVARSDRDRLILQLLWDTGMRASELLQLRVGDLARHDGRWFLRALSPHRGGGAKDSRERLVPLPRARDLKRYLDGPRARMEASSDHAFVSRRRGALGVYEPLTLSGLEQMVAAVAEDAGIARNVYPHLFRHSAVTRWRRQGVDALQVAAIVGHTSLKMIHEVYDQADHRDAYDALAAVLART
jgi:integrase